MSKPLHSVVEVDEFIRAARRAGVSDDERAEIVSSFAANPEMGVALGGGLYKARIARPGGGKRGGWRTIHFYRHDALPVFLLTLYAKNAMEALSKAEQNALADIAAHVVQSYEGRDE